MERGTDITDAKRKYREKKPGDFPDTITIKLRREWELKYGENPNQNGAIYVIEEIAGRNAGKIAELTKIQPVRSDGQGKGGLSLTNTMDITRAMDNLKYFVDVPAVVIMKHNIVAGFAKQTNPGQSMRDLFRLARDADLRSNFGGTVVFNRPLDQETAEALYELRGEDPFFVDVLAAPEYQKGVLSYVEGQAKEIRIGQFAALDILPKFKGDNTYGLLSIKEMPTGRIGIQEIYLTSIAGVDDLVFDPLIVRKNGSKHVVKRDPTTEELDDLLTAWYLNIAGARSNGVNVLKNGVSVAMGSGQVERVGAIEQMIVKGMQKAMDRENITYDRLMGIQGHEQLSQNPFEGAVSSSDAFFPFPDSIDVLSRVGVAAVVQPYGSTRDHLSIKAANKYDMAMPATLERCFGHF